MIGFSAEKFYLDRQSVPERLFAAAACGRNEQPGIAPNNRF
jgi:hypothetical protein